MKNLLSKFYERLARRYSQEQLKIDTLTYSGYTLASNNNYEIVVDDLKNVVMTDDNSWSIDVNVYEKDKRAFDLIDGKNFRLKSSNELDEILESIESFTEPYIIIANPFPSLKSLFNDMNFDIIHQISIENKLMGYLISTESEYFQVILPAMREPKIKTLKMRIDDATKEFNLQIIRELTRLV